jgi:hypothetical protein
MNPQAAAIKPILDYHIAQDFNRFTQDMENHMKDVEFFLAGQRIVIDEASGQKVLQRISDQKINELGRNVIMVKLRALLNVNTYMAQISDKDTESSYLQFAGETYRLLAENHVQYELTLPNARAIADLIMNMAFFAMRKAESDKATIYGTMNSSNQPPPQQQQGFSLPSIFKNNNNQQRGV